MSLLISLALAAADAPPQSCQAALGPLLGGTPEDALPGRVEGRTLAGPEALVRLRRERGEALITIVGGSFARADLRGVRLHNICFLGTDLTGSDWRGAQAAGVGFVRAVLSRADLRGANMRGILLREADLTDVDASRADFSEGKVDGGWDGSLQDLRLDEANLSGFQLDCGITISDGCPIDRHQVSMRRADLSRADIADAWIGAEWEGARIDRTRVSLHQLRDLATASIAGPVLVQGGDTTVELAPDEYRSLLPAIRDRNTAEAPSFDCAAARSAVERRICLPIGEMIRRDDVVLSALYREALAREPALALDQRAWLRERDRCAERPDQEVDLCIFEAYEQRKSQLIARLGPPAWARPGAVALFVDPGVELDASFRDTPLYRRLIPVIVGGASWRVLVRVNADGTIDAAGDAIGANAHMCSLSGERLRFDPATGWYSGPYVPTGDEPPEWRPRPMPVLRFWADRAEVYQNGHSDYGSTTGDPRGSDYASCGVRAGFDEMVRVPVSEAEAARILEEIGED